MDRGREHRSADPWLITPLLHPTPAIVLRCGGGGPGGGAGHARVWEVMRQRTTTGCSVVCRAVAAMLAAVAPRRGDAGVTGRTHQAGLAWGVDAAWGNSSELGARDVGRAVVPHVDRGRPEPDGRQALPGSGCSSRVRSTHSPRAPHVGKATWHSLHDIVTRCPSAPSMGSLAGFAAVQRGTLFGFCIATETNLLWRSGFHRRGR